MLGCPRWLADTGMQRWLRLAALDLLCTGSKVPRIVEASRGEEQHTWKVMDMKNSAHFEGKNYSQIFCVRQIYSDNDINLKDG